MVRVPGLGAETLREAVPHARDRALLPIPGEHTILAAAALYRTSRLKEKRAIGTMAAKAPASASAVLPRQCRGLAHHPPAGDHTYLGYS